ncbi:MULTISPECIES: DUF2971 domain-containing protein [Acinetobacter]|uniref:DUF2971 domain-containing protein n=2 Tax=Acinetobacter TaxID=469 RepID=UPI0013300B89|nr:MULTISPECIES: DUF2971 domain-containing protein [Acinetobacter]WPC34756.1 DUF2971 domain-containing protein [Acinetobacter sp. YWS30-1]
MSAEHLAFLDNSLFRITQPQYLNDPPGEARFAPFYNHFSEADFEYARKKYQTSWLNDGSIPDNNFLLNNFLLPTGMRYTVELFPSLKGFTDYETTDEIERFQAIQLIEIINNCLLEHMNQMIGIFSLSDSLTNHDMWIKYGQHGKGIALEFDKQHQFFKKYPTRKVIYSNEKRASITYYEGCIRINGIRLKDKYESALDVQDHLLNEINLSDLITRLFFTKNLKWSTENEHRIIFDLQQYDQRKENIFLKKIPFEAFKTLTFGWDTPESIIKEIFQKIKNNPALNHLRIQKVRYGQLENYDNLEVVDI